MKKDLFVVFHREAAPSRILEELEETVFNTAPSAVVCYKPFIPDSGKPAPTRPRHMINGRDLNQAVETICEKANGREVVLVTLSDEMQRAASGHDFTLITVGAPVEDTDFSKAIYAANTSFIGAHLQKLVR